MEWLDWYEIFIQKLLFCFYCFEAQLLLFWWICCSVWSKTIESSKYSRENNRWIFLILFGFFCRFYYSNSNSDSVLSIRKVTGCQLFFRPQASDSGFVHSVTQTIHDWFVIDALLLLRHEVINFFNLSSTN